MGYAYSWDFGLTRDYDELIAARHERVRPFQPWPGLWGRLQRRRHILLDYEHPPHALGLTSPDTLPDPIVRQQDARRSRTMLETLPEPIVRQQDARRSRSRSMRSSSSSSYGFRRRGPRSRAPYPDDEDL